MSSEEQEHLLHKVQAPALGQEQLWWGADREACALAVALYHDAYPVRPHWRCNAVQQVADQQHCQGLWHHSCRLVLTTMLCTCVWGIGDSRE